MNLNSHVLAHTSIDGLSDYLNSSTRRSLFGRRMTNVDRVSISENARAVLSFHHINYVVKTGSKRKHFCCRHREAKQVLFNVSGEFSNGLNAIMGPSGCGKSTLLDILADRKEARDVSGRVLVDGAPCHPSFRYTVGYVVQEDICSGTLTVRENLSFSAHLRLSKDISSDEKNQRVTQIIYELGLEHCADTKVGDESLRGISGGEKKRTCIGMELVLSPKILFLDEPTTGLDASTASNVMKCLKDLSQRGRTIIFSIHQPRYSIFKLFDSVLFMCQGKGIYQGSPRHIVPYFSHFGYPCEPYDNPADYALDILIDVSQKSETLAVWSEIYTVNSENIYQRFHAFDSWKALEKLKPDPRKIVVEPARSMAVELFYLSQRALRNAMRNPALALSQTGVSIIMGLLVGLLFYDLQKTVGPGIQNRLGAIFFVIISQVFSTVTAIEPLVKERVLFIHEYTNGYYRIFPYFISKLLCDLIPMRVIPSILFSIISYFMMGLTQSADRFFIFLLTTFIASLFGSAMCFFISASISVFAVAYIVVILALVGMMMFSGFLVDLASIVRWLSWIQWISGFRYASNALIINEFRGLVFCLANSTDICPQTGEEVIHSQGLHYNNPWDLWKNLVTLSAMALTFFILAYIQLIRIKKTR